MHKQRFLQGGMTLVEVLIAMVIGLFLLGGTMTVYLTATDSQNVNEDIARMQENARFALHTVKEDLRLAGYWGLTRSLGSIDAYKGTPSQLAALAAGDCEARFYIDLLNPVIAYNDDNPFSASCLPDAQYVDGTDVLVVRHAAVTTTAAPVAGTIYIRSDASRGEVFDGGSGTTVTFSAGFQDAQLVTHIYYVRPYTFAVGDGLPSLRRLVLGNGPAFADEEVIPGIEDFQVQYGVDDNGDGSVDRYVHPAAGIDDIQAVRLWAMSRAPTVEPGYVDTLTYTYAGKTEDPNDLFRRLLVSSTVQLRNMIPIPAP